MRTKGADRYHIHPALVAFSEAWSTLGFKTGLEIADRFQALWASTVILYRPLPMHESVGSESREIMIVGPLLPVLSWPSPAQPPSGQSLIRCALDDREIEQNLAGEWLRLMALLGDPRIVECSRRIFNRILTDEQRMRWFERKHLSQAYWAEACGLSREQMAHAHKALHKPQRQGKIATVSSEPEPNFFFLKRITDER